MIQWTDRRPGKIEAFLYKGQGRSSRKVAAAFRLYNIVCSFILLLCMLYVPQPASAQYNIPENRIWVFGFFAGLDFNHTPPLPIRTAVSGIPLSNGATGMASVGVNDRNGQLLFYTNGSHVWDRSHNVMLPTPLHPGVTNLTPVTQVTTQGTLVVPVPGDQDKYYIFSLVHPGYHAPLSATMYGKLYYSVVDMQLNGGMGGIVPGQQWQFMGEDLCDKMIAVPGDDCNVWLLTHSIDTNRFLAYEITAAGININPVISYTGSSRTIPAAGGRNLYWTNGQMSISHDFRQLAICAISGAFTEMFDFSTATGQIANPFMLDTGYAAYGLAFSPDNTKLYALALDATSANPNSWHIFQYDLAAGSQIAIRQSKTKVSTNLLSRTQLKLGPDNRIYFGNNTSERGRILGAIFLPNEPGANCTFVPKAVELLDSTSMIYGLSHEVTPMRDSVFSKKIIQLCRDHVVLKAPSGYESYVWNEGTQDTVLTVSGEGIYWVSGRKGCVVYTDTFDVRFSILLKLGPDTVLCNHTQPITLRPDTDAPVTEYLWSDGSTGRTLVVRNSGIYWVRITANGCIASDTTRITMIRLNPNLGPDTVICDLTPLTLEAEAPSQAEVLWSNGSSESVIELTESGTYWVQFREEMCEAYDTINVVFTDVRQELGPDLLLCREEPVAVPLTANAPEHASVLWSDGNVSHEVIVRDTGTYWVEVRHAQCQGQDTIHVSSAFCDCPVSFPSAFTPNGDGLNDVFRPVIGSECITENIAITVYNRWGQVVFVSGNLTSGWDGAFNGMPADAGVYMYHASVTVGTEKHEKYFKGDLTLIR